MKKAIIYLSICFLIYSCKGQEVVTEFKKADVIVFNFKEKNFNFLGDKFNTEIYNKNEFIIFIQRRQNIGYGYGEKYYSLIDSKKDTMNIKCYCPQEINYFFKNLEFQKGNFELRFGFLKKYNAETKKYEVQRDLVFGKEIKTSKEMQNILFKNEDYEQLRVPQLKDSYFKNVKFIKIDLNDTINVKLKKVEKFTNE